VADPTFTQLDGRLYTSSANPGSGSWSGYLASEGADFGTSATWDQLWQDVGGVFLFLGDAPPDGFEATLLAILSRLSPTGLLRVLWLADPSLPANQWQIDRLDALATGSGASVTWQVARQTLLLLGAYAVRVGAGSSLEQSNDPASIGLSSVSFVGPAGGYVLADASIGIGDDAIGCVAGKLSLAAGTDDASALGIRIRYATPVEDSPSGDVAALDMPILGETPSDLTCGFQLDPLSPVDPGRTRITFFGGGGTPGAFPAAFRTALGYATQLTPANAELPLWPGQLVFSRTPLRVVDSKAVSFDYALTLDGAFSLTHSGAASSALMLGLSGQEYARFETSAMLLFQSGRPAWIPANEGEARPVSEALTDLGTTAWVTVLPATAGASGLTYYAQPVQAPLFSETGGTGAFLAYLELPAATLPTWASAVDSAVPVGAYASLDPSLAELAQRLEVGVLAPVRRSLLGLPEVGSLTPLVEDTLAVTPGGLVVEVADSGTSLSGVLLANMPDSVHSTVELTEVGPALQSALQANQLFFVVSNVGTFMASSSVAYQLTPDNLPFLAAYGVPEDTIQALDALLADLDPAYPVFDNETDFDAAIAATAGEYLPACQAVGGLLEADIQGWTFQLSPRSWRTSTTSPTLMVFKFCDRSLEELAADAASWGWPEAADSGAGLGATQAVLQTLIAEASQAATDSPQFAFYEQIASNPSWNGVLFLNAPVSIAELPPDLQFMVAGIDLDAFYAHHFGMSITPFEVQNGEISLEQTAAFGLIAYADDTDLYAQDTVAFGFKTKLLTATFANAQLTGFAGQVELLTNRLFSAELTKLDTEHGNNLVLDGSYQQVDGVPAYSFVLSGTNRYQVDASALQSIDVRGVQLSTRSDAASAGLLRTDFLLQGELRFRRKYPFDAYSYGGQLDPEMDGYLRFSGLPVTMTFDLTDPDDQTFTVGEGQIAFDTSASVPRPDSLVGRFPMALSGWVAQTGDDAGTPEDLGFASISVPFDQKPMSAPWYGLVFTLELGTLGALSGSQPLTIDLLTAWRPGASESDVPAYVGIRLPVAKSVGLDWPLQGVISLGFRSFQFETYTDDQGRIAYLLLLRQLAFRVLGMAFPPGNIDVVLFGNPDQASSERLGWYACYAQDSDGDDSSSSRVSALRKRAVPLGPVRTQRRLRSGRRDDP